MIEEIMTDDSYVVLPELIPAKGKARALVSVIQVLSGIITLPAENVNTICVKGEMVQWQKQCDLSPQENQPVWEYGLPV